MSNAAVAAISVALYILLTPGVGGLLQGVDRKATARMQGLPRSAAAPVFLRCEQVAG